MNEWIDTGSESLLKQLRTRNNALKKIASFANFNLRKNLANALFHSKLVYGIQIWGTSPKYLLQKIQVEQNNSARITIGYKSKRWSQVKLLKELNWLSIDNLVKLYSAILIHQIINISKPEYLSMMMTRDDTLPTRSSAVRKLGPKPNLQGNNSNYNCTFIAKSYEIYNKLPDLVTAIHNKKIFKTKLKRFLKDPNDIPSLDDKSYLQMIPEETLIKINPQIDLTNRRTKRKTNFDE